jgi:hypothetical protein
MPRRRDFVFMSIGYRTEMKTGSTKKLNSAFRLGD